MSFQGFVLVEIRVYLIIKKIRVYFIFSVWFFLENKKKYMFVYFSWYTHSGLVRIEAHDQVDKLENITCSSHLDVSVLLKGSKDFWIWFFSMKAFVLWCTQVFSDNFALKLEKSFCDHLNLHIITQTWLVVLILSKRWKNRGKQTASNVGSHFTALVFSMSFLIFFLVFSSNEAIKLF